MSSRTLHTATQPPSASTKGHAQRIRRNPSRGRKNYGGLDEIGSLRDDPMIDHAVNITDQDFFNEFSGDDFDEDLPKLS